MDNSEDKLYFTNKRFCLLLERTPSVIFSFNFNKDFIINYISENIKEILGYDPSTFINNSQMWFDYVHPDDLNIMKLLFPNLLERGSIT